MSIGADPITAAVVTMAGVRGICFRVSCVRKEPKDHGTNRFIEGPVQPGDEVVVVEDVVTTGGAASRPWIGVSSSAWSCGAWRRSLTGWKGERTLLLAGGCRLRAY